MTWFRRHIQQGSKLALFALAIQLVLSFGHVHIDAARAAPAGPAVVSVQMPADGAPASSHQHTADFCAICAVMAMAGTAQAATPPVLLLPQASGLLQQVTAAEFLHLGNAEPPFRPRGPPAS
ncbi:MAG: DUF2946 domain-containing protein [Tardiphaga sp.]